MSLKDKYNELIAMANQLPIDDLQIREEDNVLYIDGTARSAEDKEKLWDAFAKIDPDFRAADVVMIIEVAQTPTTEYTVKDGDSLSKIGKDHGVSWQSIFEANKDVIKNPDLIQAGWTIKIPAV